MRLVFDPWLLLDVKDINFFPPKADFEKLIISSRDLGQLFTSPLIAAALQYERVFSMVSLVAPLMVDPGNNLVISRMFKGIFDAI